METMCHIVCCAFSMHILRGVGGCPTGSPPSRLEPCRFVGPEPTFLLVGRATAGPAWFTACEQPKLNEVHEVLNAMDRQDTI